jgi:small subunit ribosomal protein S10
MAAKQKIRIKVKSFDHKVIDEAAKLIIETAEKTGAIVAGPIPLPTKIEKFTVNKSTFVHKDAREQYESRTHNRLIDITETTPSTIEELSNLTLPSGVDIQIKMIMEDDPAAEKAAASKAKTAKKPAAKKAPAKKTGKK